MGLESPPRASSPDPPSAGLRSVRSGVQARRGARVGRAARWLADGGGLRRAVLGEPGKLGASGRRRPPSLRAAATSTRA